MEATIKNIFLFISKKWNQDVKNFVTKYGVEIRDEDKRTPLIHAAAYNNIELVEWLLDHGADINAADKNGYTALHFACEKSFMSILKLLIYRGVNVNTKDYYGNTPAWITVTYWKRGENMSILRELYQHNADLLQKNNAGYSPLDILPLNVVNAL